MFNSCQCLVLVSPLAEGHAETVTDANKFIVDIGSLRISVHCDEDRLQDIFVDLFVYM